MKPDRKGTVDASLSDLFCSLKSPEGAGVEVFVCLCKLVSRGNGVCCYGTKLASFGRLDHVVL